MNLKRQDLLKYFGASAALHLALGGLVFFFPLWASRPIQPVSVFQVILANSIEVKPEPQAPPGIPTGRPVQQAQGERIARRSKPAAKPVEAYTEDRKEAETATSEPTRQEHGQPPSEETQAVRASSGPPLLENSSSQIGPGEEDVPRSDELTHFIQDVRRRLEQAKGYPWLARIQGRQGTVRVQFIINSSGELQEVHLLESSRSKILDEEAVATVRRVGRFPQPPAAWHENIRIQVPLVFQLRSP
jgi:TonB family protein